jgi:hypothetical protein
MMGGLPEAGDYSKILDFLLIYVLAMFVAKLSNVTPLFTEEFASYRLVFDASSASSFFFLHKRPFSLDFSTTTERYSIRISEMFLSI